MEIDLLSPTHTITSQPAQSKRRRKKKGRRTSLSHRKRTKPRPASPARGKTQTSTSTKLKPKKMPEHRSAFFIKKKAKPRSKLLTRKKMSAKKTPVSMAEPNEIIAIPKEPLPVGKFGGGRKSKEAWLKEVGTRTSKRRRAEPLETVSSSRPKKVIPQESSATLAAPQNGDNQTACQIMI